MSNDATPSSSCPTCGNPMPAGTLAGLCPACLLAQGAETEPGHAPPGARFTPPPIQEISRLFPQLEILGLLGQGGMGAVYKARQPSLDRLVALKILPSSRDAAGAQGSFPDRFNREARALARLSHPNIVAVHEFGQTEGLSFFIMEYVDGANLRQLEKAGRLSPREALQIIPQICDALQYAHDEGVVHRDIKPENVLLDRKGRIKIADFGLAKILGIDPNAARLTAEGQVMGTPHYMAPEQLERPLAVDHRADIYSLGVVFYEMLTGDLPLGKFQPPSARAPSGIQIDVRLDEVVLRSLENDPNRRYQKASEVKSRVETIAGTPPPPAGSGSESAAVTPALRWAGFPFARIGADGLRRVQWGPVLHAFVIVFAVLTVGFGLVSMVTGRSEFGWLGVLGWQGVVVRLVLAAGIVACGVWRTLKRRPPPFLPRTPRGTVVLPPECFSRKAIAGACWAPFFVLCFLLYFFTHTVVTTSGEPRPEPPSTAFWQVALSLTVLPLGVLAPFGTTILGWLAVGDIRRSMGRIYGLGLAVFDGLLFPLAAANVFLVWAWTETLRWLERHGPFGSSFYTFEFPTVFVALGAVAICAVMDVHVVRRVWRAVRPGDDGQRADGFWWWGSPAGGVTLVLLCMAILAANSARPPEVRVLERHSMPTNPEETTATTATAPRQGQSAPRPPSPPVAPGTTATATGPIFEIPHSAALAFTPENLAAVPRLDFVAWQDAWRAEDTRALHQTDGTRVTDPEVLRSMETVHPAGCDATGMDAGGLQPRFLHLWFSHPLFDRQSLVSVTLTDPNDQPAILGAKGMMASNVHPAARPSSDAGWLTATLCPSDGRLPDAVNVRLEYAVGPLENARTVEPDYQGGMSLEGNSQLGAIGANPSGRCFITLAVDTSKLGARQFGVYVVGRNGRHYAQSGGGRSGVPGGVFVVRFEFNLPLDQVREFIVGTRPVRRSSWYDVRLPDYNE